MMDWSRKCLADFNAGKFQLVSFDCSNISSAIDVKMDGYALDEKSSFEMLTLTPALLLKLLPRKCEPWFVLWSFFLLRLPFNSLIYHRNLCGILLTCLVSGLVILNATWICWIKTPGMLGCWSYLGCFSWTLDLSSKYSQSKNFLLILLWWMFM